MDLLFTTCCTPLSFKIPCMILLCSAPSAAQCTCTPFAFAFASNCSRYSSRCESVCALICEAISLNCSHSGIWWAALSLLARTNHKVSSCHAALSPSLRNWAAALLWSLACGFIGVKYLGDVQHFYLALISFQ